MLIEWSLWLRINNRQWKLTRCAAPKVLAEIEDGGVAGSRRGFAIMILGYRDDLGLLGLWWLYPRNDGVGRRCIVAGVDRSSQD